MIEKHKKMIASVYMYIIPFIYTSAFFIVTYNQSNIIYQPVYCNTPQAALHRKSETQWSDPHSRQSGRSPPASSIAQPAAVISRRRGRASTRAWRRTCRGCTASSCAASARRCPAQRGRPRASPSSAAAAGTPRTRAGGRTPRSAPWIEGDEAQR